MMLIVVQSEYEELEADENEDDDGGFNLNVVLGIAGHYK